jgi:HEAT repeat protein
MSKDRGRLTAQEVMAQRESDPEWVADRERRDIDHREAVAGDVEAARPVVDELRAAGFAIEAIADLYHRPQDYSAAVPILLSWLPRVESRAVKEVVARALSVEWARPQAAAPLVREFRAASGDDDEFGLRWAIGNALAVVADDSVFDDVADLARDPAWGRSREMVTVALGNMADPRALDVLRGLLEDPQVAGHAVIALRKLGAREARADVERLLDHATAWVREETARALAEFDA